MSKKEKILIARLVIGALLLVGALLGAYYFELTSLQLIIVMTVPYLVISYDVIIEALENLFHAEVLDEEFLMTVATVGALALGEFAEAFAVMLLYRIGEMFSEAAVRKSKKSISELMDIKPDYALVLRGGKELTVEPEEVEIGETIIIKPGERIPLDGIITKGNATVDQSALTGESLPREVNVGDKVISGCINSDGLIEIKVTSNYAESTVAKILDLLENSADKKAKTENFVSRFAKYYTPIVVGAAVLIAIIPSIITGMWAQWIARALLLLVISCPCALVISVPLAYFCGIGASSSNGILIKGSDCMENLADVKTMLFDKTGTLTEGKFKIANITTAGIDENELLRLCAYAESRSNHPIAMAIVSAYAKEIDKEKITNLKEISGKGIACEIENQSILCGNEKLMSENGIEIKPFESIGTVVHIARNGKYIGSVDVVDKIKGNLVVAMAKLEVIEKIKCVLMTGDNEKSALFVSRKLGFEEHYSELLPKDKVDITEKYLKNSNNGKLAFVGDGINDAPVLSIADVGIAMGALGSDAAMEAADIVLMNDSVDDLVTAIEISRATKRKVKANIIFSIAVKIIVMLLGIFGIADMWLAVFADVGVSIIAVLNSVLLLVKYKK